MQWLARPGLDAHPGPQNKVCDQKKRTDESKSPPGVPQGQVMEGLGSRSASLGLYRWQQGQQMLSFIFIDFRERKG